MVKNPAIIKIKTQVLADEIKQQGVKIWWLAEQIQVDRKTVSRWVNGKVKWMREENLQATAAILGCSPQKLQAEANAYEGLYATPDEQTLAARLVHSEKLLAALTPSGKFDLAESLIKSLLTPQLPLNLLGSLHLELATCCWQQNKLREAEHYALSAMDLSERADEPLLGLSAQQTLVIIHSKRGQLLKANELIENCLCHPLIENEPLIHGRVIFDQSNTLAHAGASIDLVRSLRLKALQIFEQSGTLSPIQNSAVWLGMANFLIEADLLDEGSAALDKALAISHKTGYIRGIHFGGLIEAALKSKRGHHKEAMALFHKVHPSLQHGDMGLYEALGAQIFRRAGSLAESRALAKMGLHTFNAVFRAHNLLELAQVDATEGKLADAHQRVEEAIGLYSNAGAFGRVKKIREGLLPQLMRELEKEACPACPIASLSLFASVC